MSKIQAKSKGIRWLKRLGFLMAVLLFLILGLELAWRFQWIDTYRRELNVLNPTLDVPKSGKTILLMGDSFTAAQNSWAETLR